MNNKADKSEWYGMLTECRKRMSVSEIARRLGKSIPTINRWLNDNEAVMRDSEKLCEMLAKLLSYIPSYSCCHLRIKVSVIDIATYRIRVWNFGTSISYEFPQ